MAINLSGFAGAGAQFFDDNGDPLAGGLLYVYAAGTTTPATTYTTQSGLVNNTNPIVLDAAGRTPYEICVNGGVLYKFTLRDSASVLIGTYDNIPAIDDPTVFNNLISVTGTDTLTGTSVPPITGYTAGATYSFVAINSNTGATTISIDGLGAKEILYDSSTSLSAGAIVAGKISYIEYDGTRFQLINGITASQIPDGSITVAKLAADTRSDVASATTISLTALSPATRNIRITGNTGPIGAFTVAAGYDYFVTFSGTPTITNSASIVTQTGADIVVADGDTCILRSTAANTVEILNYVPANWNQAASSTVIGRVRFATNAEAIAGSSTTIALNPANLAATLGMTKLNSGSVSAAATLDIVMTSYTAFTNKMLVLTNFKPATDAVALWLRFSTNGGSSYDAGASDYGYVYLQKNTAGTDTSAQGAASSLILCGGIGNLSTESVSGKIDIFGTNSTTEYTRVKHNLTAVDSTGAFSNVDGSGGRAAAQDTDAIRVMFSSGNIASGTWVLYGLN